MAHMGLRRQMFATTKLALLVLTSLLLVVLLTPAISRAQVAEGDSSLLAAIRSIIESSIGDLKAEVQSLRTEVQTLRTQLQSVQVAGNPGTVAPPTQISPTGGFNANLSTGNSGTDVQRLQETLIRLGFDIPAGITGTFLHQTRDAIKQLQEQYGIPSTGILDQATRALLNRLVGVQTPYQLLPASEDEGSVAPTTNQPNVDSVSVPPLSSTAQIILFTPSDGMLLSAGRTLTVIWKTNDAPEDAWIKFTVLNKATESSEEVLTTQELGGSYDWTIPNTMSGDNEFIAELFQGAQTSNSLPIARKLVTFAVLGGTTGVTQSSPASGTSNTSNNTSNTNSTGSDTNYDTYVAFYTGTAFTTCMADYPETVTLIESWLDDGLLRYEFPWGEITGAAATKVAECEGGVFYADTGSSGGSSGSWVHKTWNFVNSTQQGSYILNRTDSEYTTFINGVYNDCTSKYFAGWKPQAGVDSAWQEFGIPECSTTDTGYVDPYGSGSAGSSSGGSGTVAMTKCFYPNATINGTSPGYTVWCEGDYYNCHKGDPNGESISLTGLQLGAPSWCETGWDNSGSTSAAPNSSLFANVITAVSSFFGNIFGAR